MQMSALEDGKNCEIHEICGVYTFQWINGRLVTNHEIGHLPFEASVSSYLVYGGKNRITVAVDNTLLQTSVPQGKVVDTATDNGTMHTQTYTFDFFNYAGIHRQVNLHITQIFFY